MSGGKCLKESLARGIKFEVRCIGDVIRSKEAKGQGASFEINLLRSRSKYEGYEVAKETLELLGDEMDTHKKLQ